MPRRVEVPFDPTTMAPRGVRVGVAAPVSDLAGLMEALPLAEPGWSQERLLPLRDAIEDAIESALDERERFVFNSVVCERRSLRDLGRAMSVGKSTVGRIKDLAIEKLQVALADHPLIKEYLTR